MIVGVAVGVSVGDDEGGIACVAVGEQAFRTRMIAKTNRKYFFIVHLEIDPKGL